MTPRFTLMTLIVATTCAWGVPAMAGFGFKNSNGVDSGPTAQRGTQAAVPTGEVLKEELALPMPGENLGDLQSPSQKAATGAPEMTPGMKTLGTLPAKQAAPPATPAMGGQGEIVAGFGKDMPLAIALEQILPKGLVPAPAEGIDMGQKVTWEGGKPWQQVLNTMLAPKGLRARQDGQQVRVEPQPGGPQFPTPDKPMFAEGPPQDMTVASRQGVDSEPLPMPGMNDGMNDGGNQNMGDDGMSSMPSMSSNRPEYGGMEPISLSAVKNDLAMPQEPMAQNGADDLSPNQPRRQRADAQPTAPQQLQRAPTDASTNVLEAAAPDNGRDGVTYMAPTNPMPAPPATPMPSGPMSTPDNYQPLPSVANTPSAAPADLGRTDVWTALAGQDLRAVLSAWSSRVNVQLVWETPYQYAVPETQSGTASYQQALGNLLDQYGAGGPKPQAKLYNASGEQAVLVIR